MFLNFCTLYVFQRKKRPDTNNVLMCVYVNKILNKNLLFYDTKLVKIRIKALKVLKLANVNNLDKSKIEYLFFS